MAEVKEQGTEQSKKPEGLLQRRVPRRQFLKGTGIALGGAGALAIEEATLGKVGKLLGLSGEKEPVKSVVETAEVAKLKFRFGALIPKIHELAISDSEKEECFQIVDKFIQVEKVIGELKNAYEENKDFDGTPTLLRLINGRYIQLDLTSLWQGEYASEEEYLKNKIFFFYGDKWLDLYLDQLLRKDQPSPLQEVLRRTNRAFFESSNNGFYLEFGTKAEPKPGSKGWPVYDFSEFDPAISPLIPPSEEEFKRRVDQKWVNVPNVGQIKIKVVNGDNLAAYNKAAMTVTLGDTDWDESEHEFRHSIDPMISYKRLAAYFKPNEIVDLLILREKILSDPTVGRRYPDIARMFSSYTTSDEHRGERLWFVRPQSRADVLGALLLKPVFDEEVLATHSIEPNARRVERSQNMDRDAPPLPPPHRGGPNLLDFEKYDNFRKFLQAEAKEVDNLARSSAVWGYVIAKIRENPELFDGSMRFLGTGSWWPISGHGGSYWESLPNLAQGILAEGFFYNDPKVMNLFDDGTQKRIILNLMVVFNWVDDEKFVGILEKHSTYPLVASFLNKIRARGLMVSRGDWTPPIGTPAP